MSSKYALSFALALLSLSTLAQVSLDSSEFPIVGTSYSMNNVAFINIPPLSAPGPNQTYSFSGGFTYGNQAINYESASLGPFSTQYPASTLSRYFPGNINDGGIDQYHLYGTDASGYWQDGMIWIGYILDTTKIDTLFFYNNTPNQDTLLTNQYTYGYTDSSYSLAELLVFFGPTPVNVDNHLIKVIDADGWGTMETGFGSYDSILRVHVTEYRYDSTFVLGNFDNATHDTIEYYLYYRQGVRYPLVKEVVEPFVEIVGPDTTYYYVTEILNIPPDPPVILGCTDTSAVNYNPLANTDDGSCVICSTIVYTLTNDTYVCAGNSVTLSVTGGASYLWSTGDTTPTIIVAPATTTTYSVLINGSQYCWEQAAVQVTVYDDVVADFWNGTPHITDTTTIVNLSTDATVFFWDFGDGTTSTEENPTKHYDSLGSYTVMLVASNPCSVDTLVTILEVVNSIREIDEAISELKMVPNPVNGVASVHFKLANSEELSLEIIDVLGRTRHAISYSQFAAGHHEYDISDQITILPAGVYFIRLQTVDGQAFLKFVKQ